MERVMSVEEKIRRAEEIYERKRQENIKPVATVSVNEKKDIKLLKKMLIQILICVSIYLIVYTIQKNEYVFSKDFIKKVDEIISYDTNFVEAYNNIKSVIVDTTSKDKDTKQDSEDEKSKSEDEQSDSNKQEENEEILIENAIGGANESESENIPQLSQEEQDIIDVKNTTSFIKPIEGSISSPYGYREKATGSVPKNHTGIDIAANKGTKILSATDGKVLVASAEGDYRETFKNSNRGSYCRICTL